MKVLDYILRGIGNLAKFILKRLWEAFWFLLTSLRP